MKKVLSLLAVVAVFMLAFTSCQPDEKTYAQYLTQQTKGWVLQSANSSPDYEMSDGTFVTDIYNNYLYDWERDYIIVFNENGSQIVKPGKTVVPDGEVGFAAETSLGNWRVEENVMIGDRAYDLLYMYLPFVFNNEGGVDLDACQIVTLNDDILQVKYTMNDDDPAAKGTYEWMLTYVPAK